MVLSNITSAYPTKMITSKLKDFYDNPTVEQINGYEPIVLGKEFIGVYYTKEYISIKFIKPNVGNKFDLNASYTYYDFEVYYNIGEDCILVHSSDTNEPLKIISFDFNYTGVKSLFNWLNTRVSKNDFIRKVIIELSKED